MISVIMEIPTDFYARFRPQTGHWEDGTKCSEMMIYLARWNKKASKQRRTAPFLSMGSKGGAVVRALAFHQCDPGSNPGVDTICGLSLLLVLSLAPRSFSPGTPVFPSPQKPTFSNSNSTRNQLDEEPLCGCTTYKSLFIYLFIHLLFIHLWPGHVTNGYCNIQWI